MIGCPICKKKRVIQDECKYCKNNYCTSCLYVFNHECPNTDDYKAAKHKSLKDSLESAYFRPSHNYFCGTS